MYCLEDLILLPVWVSQLRWMRGRQDIMEKAPHIDISQTRKHLIFVLCCAQHKTNNVVVSVMLSSINGRPSSFTHDHHKAVRVNQIGSVPPGCYSDVGCPHHN